MVTHPKEMFQNQMVHHPLLQYQMLFPSLLMSLGPPPNSEGGEDDMINDLGKVTTMDHLRFSALANQLAITQINQVLMDIIMETPGDDIKKLGELQKNFMNLIKKGFSQLNQKMTDSNTLIENQDGTLATLQDVAATGFLDNLGKMVALQDSVKQLSNRTTHEAKDFQGKLVSIEDNLEKIQNAINNITEDSLCCKSSMKPGFDLVGQMPPTEAPIVSEDILLAIQDELRNLTRTIGAFISTAEDPASKRARIENLIETCSNASAGASNIDLRNITGGIAEVLDLNIQPQVGSIKEDLGKVNSTLVGTQDDLRLIWETLEANLTRSETELETLKKLTIKGFADISVNIKNIYNATLEAKNSKAAERDCPVNFFPVDQECFALFDKLEHDFETAKMTCNDTGAYLAEPQSLMKFFAFVSDIDFNNEYGMWMGGKGMVKAQFGGHESVGYQPPDWKWLTSEKKINHGWNLDQPSSNGYCVILSGQGPTLGLAVADCDIERGVVCQYS